MNVRTVLTLALVAAALGGCRSDGGFGRRDSSRSMGWTFDHLASRTAEDAGNTVDIIAEAPGAIGRSVEDSMYRLGDTYRLYFEGTEKRR